MRTVISQYNTELDDMTFISVFTIINYLYLEIKNNKNEIIDFLRLL
jgi:hypothetical protein